MRTDREFTTLAETYMDMIYRIALNTVRCPADAEDVMQNVLLRLYRSGTEFESSQHAKHWLIRVTVNESKRLMGAPWRSREAGLEEAVAEIAAASSGGGAGLAGNGLMDAGLTRAGTVGAACAGINDTIDQTLRRELLAAVLGLPVKYRLPLYLYYYEGYSVKEIGQLLNRRESTVQTQLARGREKLKTVLEEERR